MQSCFWDKLLKQDRNAYWAEHAKQIQEAAEVYMTSDHITMFHELQALTKRKGTVRSIKDEQGHIERWKRQYEQL